MVFQAQSCELADAIMAEYHRIMAQERMRFQPFLPYLLTQRQNSRELVLPTEDTSLAVAITGENGYPREDTHGLIQYRENFSTTTDEVKTVPAGAYCYIGACESNWPYPHAHVDHNNSSCHRLENYVSNAFNRCKLSMRKQWFDNERFSFPEFMRILLIVHDEGSRMAATPLAICSQNPGENTLAGPGKVPTWYQLASLPKYWKARIQLTSPKQAGKTVLALMNPNQKSIIRPAILKCSYQEAFLNLVAMNFPELIAPPTVVCAWIMIIIDGCRYKVKINERAVHYKAAIPEYLEVVRKHVTLHWEILEAMAATSKPEAVKAMAFLKRYICQTVGLNPSYAKWISEVPDCFDYLWSLHILLTYGCHGFMEPIPRPILTFKFEDVALEDPLLQILSLHRSIDAEKLVDDQMVTLRQNRRQAIFIPYYFDQS